MPTHLLLEGPDIESVLGRLREDHGPDAKIVQAELVRSGGFGGFFAKRRYEVTVEVDDDQPAGAALVDASAGEMATGEIAAAEQADVLAPAAAASSGFTPYGIDALLSAAERMDQAEVGGRTVVAAAAPTPTTVPVQAPAAPATGWHRPVSTEGTAFSDVLGALTHDLAAPVAEPSAADLPAPRAPLDAPTEPKPEPEPEFEQQPVFERRAAPSPAPSPSSGSASSWPSSGCRTGCSPRSPTPTPSSPSATSPATCPCRPCRPAAPRRLAAERSSPLSARGRWPAPPSAGWPRSWAPTPPR